MTFESSNQTSGSFLRVGTLLYVSPQVDVLGVAVNKVPYQSHALISRQLKQRFGEAGVMRCGGA